MTNVVPIAAVVFLICITFILFIMVLFLLYIKQIGCCKHFPTPLCFADRPKIQHMDDSDEEVFDKFEDLVNCCPDKSDKPISVDIKKFEEFKIMTSSENGLDITDSGVDQDSAIQISLRYHPADGKLFLQLIKGNYLQCCYIKLLVCTDSGHQLSHVDSKVTENEIHPNFNETFEFNIPQFQIKSVTLMVSAYRKVSLLHKEMIGWIAIGSYNSSNDQLSHWNEVLSKYENEVVRWHKLLKSEFLKVNF